MLLELYLRDVDFSGRKMDAGYAVFTTSFLDVFVFKQKAAYDL